MLYEVITDGVTLLLPNSDPELAMKAPLQRRFTLVGLLELGGQLDGMLGFMHLADAQAALGWGDKVQGFSLKVADLMQAQSLWGSDIDMFLLLKNHQLTGVDTYEFCPDRVITSYSIHYTKLYEWKRPEQ